MNNSNIEFFSRLETIVQERLEHPGDKSYTAKLAAAGPKRIAQKLGEEGVELALAATSGNREEIIDEAADLVFHLIVLLAHQGLSLGDIAKRLELRHVTKTSTNVE